jgi:bacillaene synthase trans-acting acyltransferase
VTRKALRDQEQPMRKPIVFMFSGQGSQYYQMGRELFHRSTIFKSTFQSLDEIVKAATGTSIASVVYDANRKKSESFDRLLWTHPAIFMFEYALAHTLLDKGIRPDIVLGASLGTYVASVIAESLDVEDALLALVAQARLLEQCGTTGSMVAAFADVSLYHSEPRLRENCEIAAVNFPGHIVLAVRPHGCETVLRALRERNVVHQQLAVKHAFHSRFIDSMKQDMTTTLRSLVYKPPKIPLLCCALAGEAISMSGDHFWSIAREPIKFKDTIDWNETKGSFRYVDLGPSGTLATFAKYNIGIDSQSTSFSVTTPFGDDMKGLEKALFRLCDSPH